ncbi:MoxR family ATPase [Candidatus Dependentiae bacterium]|nr:MoxR family ATPase [Candidatus Dependentiae bacterium]
MNTIDQNYLEKISDNFQQLTNEVNKIVVGQTETCNFILLAILCNGHILLEGVPGVAKTTIIKAVTKAMGLSFKRIQFTPDLLPADLIGTLVYNPKTQEFETKKGPIFANLILADEINRAPAKVQAALLEAMQEHQVTIGSTTHILEEPFLVFATQNPLEQEGTYRLPEAQVDRFMFKLIIGYPNIMQEREILHKNLDFEQIKQVLNKPEIFDAQKIVNQIYIDEKIINYIVDIVFATRTPENFGLTNLKKYISYGVSPRATIALHNAAKANAFLNKRNFVIPDDVKFVCPAILRHRLILNYEAEAENITSDHIIKTILQKIACP